MVSDFIIKAEADGWFEKEPGIWWRNIKVPLSEIGDESDWTYDVEYMTTAELFEVYREKD